MCITWRKKYKGTQGYRQCLLHTISLLMLQDYRNRFHIKAKTSEGFATSDAPV